MNNYSQNITADSFTGEVFAFEGINGVITLVNGPSGCKFYHSATADNQTIKQLEFDPLNFPEKWYFGQPRVPCTYLDTKDYVYGSENKLIDVIKYLNSNASFDLLCIVNSPGAALIGDNLNDIVAQVSEKPFVTIESPGYSQDISFGYENAVINLFKQLKLIMTDSSSNCVNILGLSIYHKNHKGDIAELRRLFSLVGIEINCFVCSDCDLETIKSIPNAALNIVIHPEYGLKTAKFLNEKFKTPFYVCSGPPIGFQATETMMCDICNLLGKDASKVIIDSEKARAIAYAHISRVNSLTGLPKAVKYSIGATYSEIYAYTNFLSKYFGMVLESTYIECADNIIFEKKLLELLSNLKLNDALNREILDTTSELVFANGNIIAQLKLLNKEFCGIEIALPSLGYIDVIPKTHLGTTGALLLCEQVLNGLMF